MLSVLVLLEQQSGRDSNGLYMTSNPIPTLKQEVKLTRGGLCTEILTYCTFKKGLHYSKVMSFHEHAFISLVIISTVLTSTYLKMSRSLLFNANKKTFAISL